jgi:glycosyltransferase involved in cell wall biosynthesis
MKIQFLTSGHYPWDDRIFYHMAASLVRNGHIVEIISSKIEVVEQKDGISLNCFYGDKMGKRTKIEQFLKRITLFTPDTVICSEPLALIAAKKYRGKNIKDIKIIYDITEWYPSKKNLTAHAKPARWLYFLMLLIFNIRASACAASFIFGEWYKSRPYRLIFPSKKYIYVSYFPDPEYISPEKPCLPGNKVRLTYSGKISREKGYDNFFYVLRRLSVIRPDLKMDVKIIGWYESEKDRMECESLFINSNTNISMTIYGRQGFHEFISLIKDTDIFMDLRKDDFENHRCLPIKLFYYAHMGRPVIFSDLKSVRREVEIERFGYAVKPEDTDNISRIILKYIDDKDLYLKHCSNAMKLAKDKYNWKLIEQKFIEFISGEEDVV